MTSLHRVAVVALALGATVGCDQATKRIASASLQHRSHSFLADTFRLTYAENRGAFLSLGSELPETLRFLILTVGVGLLLVFLVGYALVSKSLDGPQVAAYAIVAGGGISNWLDRALHQGRVVDFMNMGVGRLRTGVFNVADIAILAGIGLLLVAGWRKDRRDRSGATAG